MNKTSLMIVASTLLSAAPLAKDKHVDTIVPDDADDVPCTCVFNQNRAWNPEKVLWNEQY